MNHQMIATEYARVLRPLARAELDWFASQPNLKMAVSLAAQATGRDGKRLSHQWRIQSGPMQEAHTRLMSVIRRLRRSQSFADLHGFIEQLVGNVHGIGELYVYDTALRIGAYLNLLPTEVYVHSGVRVGARKLGFRGSHKTIAMRELPQAFQRLAPHEVEDVICIYKDVLDGDGFAESKCSARATVDPIC